jgi:putative ABC transport system permease protein
MLRVALSGLRAHRRRFLSTLLAVVLGISFLCGTLVLADTLQQAFQSVLSTGLGSVDVYARHTRSGGRGGDRGGIGVVADSRLDAGLIDTIRAVPGVASAEGEVQANGIRMVGKNGKVLGATPGGGGGGGRGVPSRGTSWRTDPAMNPFKLVSGGPPVAATDVVIDRASSKNTGLTVGDSITILVPDPTVFHITGVATFGKEDSRLGGTDALFNLSAAQNLLGATGQVDGILVRATPGVTQEELAARITGVLPAGNEAVTATVLNTQTQDGFQRRISAFTSILSGFAFIAVIVGAFVIYNTFAIIIAQRTRELGLLRALGAGRRQVLTSVVVEAFIVGVVSSAVGVGGGLFMGAMLRRILRAGGLRFPPGGLVMSPSTAITGMAVGVGVTVLASILPATRAARIAPMQALREAAVDASAQSRIRAVIGAIVTAAGLGLAVKGVIGKSANPIGFGAALALVGIVMLGPVLAGPLSRAIGAPIRRFRGISGDLAQLNATRNPQRTAGTATALLIGVAVVTFFGVVASSLTATTNDQISRTFVGDLAVRGVGGRNGGFSPTIATAIAGLPEVAVAVPIRTTNLSVGGQRQSILSTDPVALGKVVKLDMIAGTLSALSGDQAAVSDATATEQHWNLGDKLVLSYPDSGDRTLTVTARFLATDVIDADIIVPLAVDNQATTKPRDRQVLVKLKPGVSFTAGRIAVETATKAEPTALVQDEQELKKSYTGRISSLLAIIFGMLALAIIIALIGISNTLQLSVHERTREIGLLRALGASRGQIRAMVRWESVVIALLGTLGGTAVGMAFGWAIIHGLGRDSNLLFSVPLRQTLIIVVVGALAGIVAALRPASNASKLDILRAISTE